MSNLLPVNPGSTKWIRNTAGGAASVSVTIPLGTGAQTLIVIDKVYGSVLNGAGTNTINLSIGPMTDQGRYAIGSGVAVTVDVDFHSGLPLWAASNDDSSTGIAAPAISLSGWTAAGSFASLMVSYHYENPGARRQ